MFERFTEKAIKVIMLAQEESRRLGHNFVGTEQLLLGLISEGTGIASKTLKSMGVNIKEAREEVEKNFGISGINGGGAQRLNIIEFDELNMGACKGIALDLAKDVKSVLTDKQGPFKLKDVVFNGSPLPLDK